MVRSIPEETIKRIKNTANIVEVVSDHVVLRKAGRNYLGLCPFHAEKTPSFTVSPEKQIYYCFGCHTGGNIFSFIMQHEGISFPEAVRVVAGRYGIEVPAANLSPEQKQRLSENEHIYAVNDAAMRFYRQMLNDRREGAGAMSYLLGRGMTRQIIDGHQLGYAPNRWDALVRHFADKKVPAGRLLKAGLTVPRKNNSGHYDRFRDRVIFPIFNLSRQVIGFGGRVMGDDMPKYLNSPETPVYNKRRCLYAMDKANRPARAAGKVYVVEGYFDALAMHLYGIENAVATLGTALTPEHVQLLKGMVGRSGQVILVFDSDQAGIQAAQRSVTVFEEGFLDARILVLPPGYDPDLFLREHGPDDFLKAADKALGMMPFIIEMAVKVHGLSLEGKIKVVDEVQKALSQIQDTVARSLYVKQLAERLAIDEAAILEKVNQAAGRQATRAPHAPERGNTTAITDSSRLERQIIAMMLCYPVMIPEIVGRNLEECFEDERLKAIARMILQRADGNQGNVADMASLLDDPEDRNLLVQLAISDCHWDRQGCERVLAQFAARHKRRTTEVLQRQIEAAERNNDMDLLSKLLLQKQRQAGKGLINL